MMRLWWGEQQLARLVDRPRREDGIPHVAVALGVTRSGKVDVVHPGRAGDLIHARAVHLLEQGALGGYVMAPPTQRLTSQGDFLYIKVTPNNDEAPVTDWRLAANRYFFPRAGLGVQ